MEPVDLHLEPNEASDLAAIPAAAVPGEYDAAYVTVLDEGAAERSIAVVAHRAGTSLDDGWEPVRLRLAPTDHEDRTEDAEACAFHGGRLYVAGSQYGSKDGPLQPKRAWFARMAEEDLTAAIAGERVALEVARLPFALHRAVNDVLAETGVELLPLGERLRRDFVEAAVDRGRDKDKRWKDLVRATDHPINVEGMTFGADGALLVGLRYPVTADGQPLIVAVPDPDALFDGGDPTPDCATVWALETGGATRRPVGIRGMHTAADGAVHVLVGSLDAEGKDSALLVDHPGGGAAHNVHWRVEGELPASGGRVPAERVHEFPDLKSVEGLAQTPDGHFLYVVDRDHGVHLRFLLID